MMLTDQDYEGLLRFSAYINRDYDKFIENVLFAMSEIFNLQLVNYSIFDKDAKGTISVERLESNSIYPAGLAEYQKSIFKTDLFVQRTDYAKQGVPQKNVITIPDVATYDEFYATDYGKYLQRINTPYQAALRSTKPHRFPVHTLSVFKTYEQGDFTEYELLLLDKIGKVYSEGVGFYKRHIFALNYAVFLDIETARTGAALAIVDAEGTLLYRNNSFVQTAFQMFGSPSELQCVMAIFNQLFQQTGMRIHEVVQPISLHCSDYHIEITMYRPICCGQPLHIYFLMLSPFKPAMEQKAPSDTDGFHMVEEYGFTLREVEIAKLLVSGRTNPQIADDLYISVPTVRFHVQNIFKKLGVKSRSGAVAKLVH